MRLKFGKLSPFYFCFHRVFDVFSPNKDVFSTGMWPGINRSGAVSGLKAEEALLFP